MKHRLIALLLMVGCSGGENQPLPTLPPIPVKCSPILRWILPTEDVLDRPLESDELTEATLYIGLIPFVFVDEISLSIGEIEPYALQYTHKDIDPGLYYYRLTVSNAVGESEMSNMISIECR